MDEVEAFCRAMWRHEPQTIAELAPRVDPDGKDRFGYTPLLMAARYGDLATVTLLVRRGADLDQGRTLLTPITHAARRGAGDLVAFLRAQGARESILTAVYLGDLAQVERALARAPASAHLRDEEGTPLVLHAAESLRPELLECLLAHGATLAETDAGGETALHRVADLRGAPAEAARRMASLLLDRGAQVNARNWDEVTPLHQAVRARQLAVAEVLLARGADANARDKRHSTPLRRAVSGTGAGGTAGTAALMLPLARLLLAHGADPEARDKRGVPVHASARAPALRALFAEHARQRPRPGKPRR